MPLLPDDIPGMADFEFDLETPLFQQIRQAFDAVAPVALDPANVRQIHERPGIYGLLLRGDLVYIGKADRSVRGRLLDHHWTLSGRLNLSVNDVSFKAVVFAETWNPFKPEAALVEEFGTNRTGWNGKGFGIHDPGRKRDHTDLGDDHFHVLYPLNHDLRSTIRPSEYVAWELLEELKSTVPYFIRFDKRAGPKRVLQHTNVSVPRQGMTVQEVLMLVAQALGSDWQLTRTPSHFLLYRESGVSYPRATVLWPAL